MLPLVVALAFEAASAMEPPTEAQGPILLRVSHGSAVVEFEVTGTSPIELTDPAARREALERGAYPCRRTKILGRVRAVLHGDASLSDELAYVVMDGCADPSGTIQVVNMNHGYPPKPGEILLASLGRWDSGDWGLTGKGFRIVGDRVELIDGGTPFAPLTGDVLRERIEVVVDAPRTPVRPPPAR